MAELYTDEDVKVGRNAWHRIPLDSNVTEVVRAVLDAVAPAIAARALREAADRYLGFTRPDSGLIPKEWANGFMEAIDGVAKDLSKHADEIEEARRG